MDKHILLEIFFQGSNDETYKRAWIERIEPNLELYKPESNQFYNRHLISLLMEGYDMAVYGNFVEIRYIIDKLTKTLFELKQFMIFVAFYVK